MGDDWNEWRNFILKELERIAEKLDSMHSKIDSLKNDHENLKNELTRVKTKSTILWSVLGGGLSAFGVFVVSQLWKT